MKLKETIFVGFDPADHRTWPLKNLRIMVIQKPTELCPKGFHMYAKRKQDEFVSLLYHRTIPVNSISSWRYEPLPDSYKKFTPKIYKANEE